MDDWQPIETAPKDGTAILAYCRHESDRYVLSDTQLTEYGCHCEAYAHAEDGIHIIEWGGGSTEGSWEEGYYDIPDWWFIVGTEFEVVCAPTHWIPLPNPPKNA